jgi:hypothetical protein
MSAKSIVQIPECANFARTQNQLYVRHRPLLIRPSLAGTRRGKLVDPFKYSSVQRDSRLG